MVTKRVLVIGLDGTPPELLFGMREQLPNIDALMRKSLWAPMRTCIPPVTNPA
ncbi:alkaline phosphatase family protein, partial [archaeon]